MADRWKDRLDRIDRAVDRAMSETVRFVPVREGDFSGVVPDPDRVAFEADGVLTIDRGETDMGGNAARLRNARVVTAKAELQIMKSRLPPGFEPRKDDRIEAPAQGLVFKIDRIDRQHPGRVAFALSIIAGAP
jgi:hypothetical protein